MELMMLLGLLFLVFNIVIPLVGESDNDRQEEYIIKGIGVAFLAVGIFGAISWVARVVTINPLEVSPVALSGWLAVVPLMLMVLFSLGNGRRT